MNALVAVAGLLLGLGVWLAIRELVPAGPSLRAAIGRLDSRMVAEVLPERRERGRADRLIHRLGGAVSWLRVPVADLRLLGQDRDQWLARKLAMGISGLAVTPVLSAVLSLGGYALPWTIPVAGSLAIGTAAFFVPDVVTRANATAKRADFRLALISYLDLVVLERGAGAAPTEALEAAAEVGGGWVFARIAEALDQARKASRAPWEGIAQLAAEDAIPELSDLADIAGIAGNEGARIIDTLSARAESMRAEALAATKARAGSRSTTMVIPIALLAFGFLLLLIFPDFYRTFG